MSAIGAFNKSIIVFGLVGLIAACGSNDKSDPNTILNGSFESGDYTSWVLEDDSGVADTGVFANLPAGVTFPAGTLYDYQDGVDVGDGCMGSTFPVSIVSDGLRAGLHTQNEAARHTMSQDVYVESNATVLRWDMAYDSGAAINSSSQYIAVNIIDPVTLVVLDTPFKLDPLVDPQQLLGYATFEVDLTPYRNQNIRIELELQIQDTCFAVFFDNFRIN